MLPNITLKLKSLSVGKEADRLVYLTEDVLEHVEYLFRQSARGVHFLFSNEDIKRVLSLPTEDMDFFSFENVEKVQRLLTEFLEKKSLRAKQDYLSKLDQTTHDLLLRTYFNIVENSIFESEDLKH